MRKCMRKTLTNQRVQMPKSRSVCWGRGGAVMLFNMKWRSYVAGVMLGFME